MDDLQDLFSNRKKTPVEEAWHMAQERKKYDIVRVANPASITLFGITYQLPQKDFYVEYDVNQFQRVAFNSTIDIPRYIAMRYNQHKKDEIVNIITQKMHDQTIEDRRRKGFPDFKDKAAENAETYESNAYPKTNDPRVIAEISDQLWIGLVHEFGRDIPPSNLNVNAQELDMTPPEMKVMDTLNKKRVDMGQGLPAQPFNSQSNYQTQSVPQKETPRQSPFSSIKDQLTAADITAE